MSGLSDTLLVHNRSVRSELEGVGGKVERLSTARSSGLPNLSKQLWGFSPADGLPRVVTQDGVTALAGDFERARSFLSAHFGMFSEESLGASPSLRVQSLKSEYLEKGCDILELRHDESTVGVLIGAPEDWSSYYVRVFAVVRGFQRPLLIRRFIRECLFRPLVDHGVERIVADTSPANLAMSRLLSELRFVVTGTQLTDRWGAMVRFTRFLMPEREAEFCRKFGETAPAESTVERKEKAT